MQISNLRFNLHTCTTAGTSYEVHELKRLLRTHERLNISIYQDWLKVRYSSQGNNNFVADESEDLALCREWFLLFRGPRKVSFLSLVTSLICLKEPSLRTQNSKRCQSLFASIATSLSNKQFLCQSIHPPWAASFPRPLHPPSSLAMKAASWQLPLTLTAPPATR